MTQYKTLSDVLAAKRDERHAEAARWAKSDAARAKFIPRTDLHPAVGVLVNAKGVRYYAYVKGVLTQGSPEHLATFLEA
jgi:hypothetical protein